jgi:hypothetical protein
MRTPRHYAWTIAMIVTVSCATTTSQPRIGDLQPSASRSEWRQQLHWPEVCEQAFGRTREQRGSQSGVRVMRLSSGWRVVEVRCAAGAYQPSQMFVGISPTGIASRPIPVQTLAFDDQGRPKWSTSEEVWGNVTFAADAHELTIVNMARGLGDCGSMIVYRIDADAVISFKAATARGKACDDKAQAPTSWPVIQE